MDILDEISRLRQEQEFDAERAERVRRRLAAEFAVAPRRGTAARPYAVVGAGLVAAATVTAVVIGQHQTPITPLIAVTTPPAEATASAPPSATPSAPPSPESSAPAAPPTVDTVLAHAAAASGRHEIADGQYRRVSVAQRVFSTFSLAPDSTITDRTEDASQVVTATLSSDRIEVFVPSERAREWPERRVGERVITQRWGDASLDLTGFGGLAGYVEWKRTWDLEGLVGPLADLPRDPARLLETMRAAADDDEHAYWMVLRSLESNAMPADLQAALYGAARLIPGATLESFDQRIAVITWTSAAEPRKRFRLTIDTTTSFVTESDWWWGRADVLGVPADVPDVHREISVDTVNALPDGLG